MEIKDILNLKNWLNKKGISSTVIGVIILIVGLAIVVFLIVYFGTEGRTMTRSLVNSISRLRGGG